MKAFYLRSGAAVGAMFAFFASPHLHAKESDYPPPKPPLVAPLPVNGHWTITIKLPDAPANAGSTGPALAGKAGGKGKRELESLDVVKTGDLKRDQQIYSTGDKYEIWYTQGLMLSPNSTGQLMIYGTQFGDLNINPIRSVGYTGINWIDLENYDRVVTFEKRPAYHYVKIFSAPFRPGRKPTGAAPPPPPPKTTMECWIDVKTGQPLGYTDSQGKIYSYTFLPPPSAPLELPPAYQTGLAEYLGAKGK